jgi:hypothetical protein
MTCQPVFVDATGPLVLSWKTPTGGTLTPVSAEFTFPACKDTIKVIATPQKPQGGTAGSNSNQGKFEFAAPQLRQLGSWLLCRYPPTAIPATSSSTKVVVTPQPLINGDGLKDTIVTVQGVPTLNQMTVIFQPVCLPHFEPDALNLQYTKDAVQGNLILGPVPSLTVRWSINNKDLDKVTLSFTLKYKIGKDVMSEPMSWAMAPPTLPALKSPGLFVPTQTDTDGLKNTLATIVNKVKGPVVIDLTEATLTTQPGIPSLNLPDGRVTITEKKSGSP